jgi:RNA polymerase sigma factor (sigma-70 family)
MAKVPLDEALGLAQGQATDYAALNDALDRLAEIDPRQARIVELHNYFGFEHKEIAEILGISETTSKREWRTARLWLYRELSRE